MDSNGITTRAPIYLENQQLMKRKNSSACRLRRAIALAHHRSRKIHLRRAINWSPAHEKSLASSNNKKYMFHFPFIFWELKNFPYKAASSRTSNNKHDCVCHICLRYRTAFVTGCSRTLLFTSNRQSLRKALIFVGFKKKIVQFRWCENNIVFAK